MGSRTTIFVMFLFILPTLIISDTSPIQRAFQQHPIVIMEILLLLSGIQPLNV